MTCLIGDWDLFGFPSQQIAELVNNPAVSLREVDRLHQLCLDFILDDHVGFAYVFLPTG
jgi:hypothetical protein